MKKLVLVAALFMFVCGGSFVANAQDPVKTQQQQPATEKTEEPKATEPAKEEPKAEEPKAEEPKAEAPANGQTTWDHYIHSLTFLLWNICFIFSIGIFTDIFP